jgi:8-oxo-dGTP pyrophosphatase MutT (NUDIX family)
MFSWLAHFIERNPSVHRLALTIWRHFPPRLAGLMKVILTTKWVVGAVAVIIDENVGPMEVLLVEHSYRRKGIWGLPGGALEPKLVSPLKAGAQDDGDVLKSTLRREIYEELGIEIEIGSLIRIDAVPYVPEEPGPYRLDFYYLRLPKYGIGALRGELASDSVHGHSPEIKSIRFVPLISLPQYDLYSSDKDLLIERWPEISPFLRSNSAASPQ